MCSRGVLLSRNSEDNVEVVNTPSYLRVNSFLDDDSASHSKGNNNM